MLVEGKATAGADIGFCLDNGDDETKQSCCPTKRCWQSTVEESLTTKPENCDWQNGTLNESSKSRNNNSNGSRDFDGWLRSFGLKSRDEMPFYCHESYILHGYRPNPSSLAFCLRSLFHPTNETLNVWTHAIPAVLLIWFNMSFAYNNLDGVIGWNDHIMLPYWIFTLGIGISLLGSSGAHLFNCMSPAVREVCFCCDYGFIAFQAMGITCFFTFYLCPYTCMGYYKGEWFLIYVAIMLGNVGSVSAACHTRYPNVPLRYLFRVLPFAVMYTILNIPCITKYSAIDETDSSTVALNNHDIHGNLSSTLACGIASTREGASDFYKLTWSMLLGAIINAAKLPERLKPGFFDIVGHSHQIFHLLVVFGIYYICKLLHIALGDVVRMRKTGAFPQAEDLNITSFTGLAIPVMCCVLSLMVSVRYSLDFYVRCKALKLIDKVQ